MSAPSELHAHRVQILGDLADLSGFTLDIAVHTGLWPDICRLHHHAGSILIADAKATESAGDGATRRRLARYAAATRLWTDAGLQVAFGVCHGPDDHGAWNDVIVTCLAAAKQRPIRTTYAALDLETAVSMVMIDAPSSEEALRTDPYASAGAISSQPLVRP